MEPIAGQGIEWSVNKIQPWTFAMDMCRTRTLSTRVIYAIDVCNNTLLLNDSRIPLHQNILKHKQGNKEFFKTFEVSTWIFGLFISSRISGTTCVNVTVDKEYRTW